MTAKTDRREDAFDSQCVNDSLSQMAATSYQLGDLGMTTNHPSVSNTIWPR